VNLVILDDHEIFSASLTRLLADDPGISVTATVTTVQALAPALGDPRPDVVMVDWQLPDGTGADAIRVIRRVSPQSKVIVLTGNGDDATLQQAVAAGCDGFVTKDRPPADLVRAIHAADRGEVAFDPVALGRVLDGMAVGRSREDVSERELEVIELLAQGASNKQIAEQLFLSPNTVRNHIHRISKKFGVTSRLEIVMEAARSGLVKLPG
jgi:DNA-binding NarL/FixJ family response regulator